MVRTDDDLKAMLAEYRDVAIKGIEEIIPDKEPKKYLYDLMMEYPKRGGKGFRPALAISVCKAHGGRMEDIRHSATALELFHNAFLIHDDVEDYSYFRRGEQTIHQKNNAAIAVNLGDAMNVLSFSPLIKNREVLGANMAWKVFMEIHHMVTETVEGQALELGWRKDNHCKLVEDDYFRMILKKTCWYTCIYPIRIGAIIGRKGKVDADKFNRFGYFMGSSFQIQDDILNLVADEEKYGKEIKGDIIEGKRTLMLIHLLNNCTKKEHREIESFLADDDGKDRDQEALRIFNLMVKHGSIDHTIKTAKTLAGGALKEFYSIFSRLPASKDKDFLERLILYMINRDY